MLTGRISGLTQSGCCHSAAPSHGGPLGMLRGGDDEAYRVPALPLARVLSDPRVLLFLGVWFGINIIFGIGSLSFTGNDQPVGGPAPIGGFFPRPFVFF